MAILSKNGSRLQIDQEVGIPIGLISAITDNNKVALINTITANEILKPTLYTELQKENGDYFTGKVDFLTWFNGFSTGNSVALPIAQSDVQGLNERFSSIENAIISVTLYEAKQSGTTQGSLATQTGIQILRDTFTGADLDITGVGGDGYPNNETLLDLSDNIVTANFDPIDQPPNWVLDTPDSGGTNYALHFRVRGSRSDIDTYLTNNPQYGIIDAQGISFLGLNEAYLNGSSIFLSSDKGEIEIKDAVSSIGDLLSIKNNDDTTTYFRLSSAELELKELDLLTEKVFVAQPIGDNSPVFTIKDELQNFILRLNVLAPNTFGVTKSLELKNTDIVVENGSIFWGEQVIGTNRVGQKAILNNQNANSSGGLLNVIDANGNKLIQFGNAALNFANTSSTRYVLRFFDHSGESGGGRLRDESINAGRLTALFDSRTGHIVIDKNNTNNQLAIQENIGLRIFDGVQSTSSTTGDIVTSGGIGVGGNVNILGNANAANILGNLVPVRQNNYASLLNNIDASKVYFIDGVVDIGSLTISTQNLLSITGYNSSVSQIISSASNATLIGSPTGGNSDIRITNVSFSASGSSSKVFDLLDSDGTHSITLNDVGFVNCTSKGFIEGFNLYVEQFTANVGGTPTITFDGDIGGVRITVCSAFNMNNFTSFFIAGVNLSISGRFITDINIDLPQTGAFFDFSDTHFTNDEAFQINNANITRQGVLNASDTTIYPNVKNDSVKSLWKENAGLPNTVKSIELNITTQVKTPIATRNVFVDLLGTYQVNVNTHWDSPSNGVVRLLTSSGQYKLSAYYILDSLPNNNLMLRLVKSTDNGATFTQVVRDIEIIVNSIVGVRDVAFLSLNFPINANKNDQFKWQVANLTASNDIIAEKSSFYYITE